jgi:putative NADPH-quinone reductase
MLKSWFDRVLAYGEVYTGSKRFENGRFVGKRAMLSVTAGTSRATYARMTGAAGRHRPDALAGELLAGLCRIQRAGALRGLRPRS